MDFGELVTSETELRELVPAPRDGAPALRKQIDHLDEHCRDFIARSPFFVLATAAADDEEVDREQDGERADQGDPGHGQREPPR